MDPRCREDAARHLVVLGSRHAQTDRGFRQYLTRALREGATAAEVLDALLMAFPALGLAKIVWATDIILKMNLPEFAAAFRCREDQPMVKQPDDVCRIW